MNTRTSSALVVAGVFVASVLTAEAQTPPPAKRIFVDVNLAVQPSARTFQIDASPQVYGEAAIINALQGVDGAGLLDVSAGYRVWRNVSLSLGLTTTMTSSGEAAVKGGIPHPVFFDTRLESITTVTDLHHKERSAHLSVMWTSPVTDRIDASVSAGPSFVKVFQDLVTEVTVSPGTQTFAPVDVKQTATKLGVHFGGEVTYLLTPRIGVGGMFRFVKAKVDLPSVPALDAAGVQYGGGVRLRF